MAAQAKINIMQLLVQHVKDEWVMWPLVALSMVSLAIVVERLLVIFLDRKGMSPETLVEKFLVCLENSNGDKEKAIQEMEAFIGKKENISTTLIRHVFRKYREGVEKNLSPIEMKQWLKDSAEEQALLEFPALDARLGWLAIISNVATLMGLFGTVYGMIEAFYSMAQSVGGVKADEMAGGIAVALIATLFGLFVAIPSLILYNLIKNSMESHVLFIDEATTTVIDRLVA
jgi:biopolymer transport protein ExbB